MFEDWLFHTALHFLAYAALFPAALTLVHHIVDALFGIGAASILPLFMGIHNAWDSVTYIAGVPEEGDQPRAAPANVDQDSQAT